MKLTDLARLMDGLKIPWVNTAYEPQEAPPLPYICLVADAMQAANADGYNWYGETAYSIEFYSKRRDYMNEKRIQAALDAAQVPFFKSVYYIEQENMIETLYSVSVYED